MKKLIKTILFGDAQIDEYLKVTIPKEIKERVYLAAGDQIIDVSRKHWLLCIEPVIFGIWLPYEDTNLKSEKRFKLYFTAANDLKDKNATVVHLNAFDSITDSSGVLMLLKVSDSEIKHLNWLTRHLLYWKYYRKNGLTYSKFKTFVAAYSYPRQISIVSYRDETYYNIFPMDLLGSVENTNRFVFGLRHTNVALAKIVQGRKLVVCEAPHHFKDTIYQLGKHHSSDPPTQSSLPFSTIKTKEFEFYIPSWAEKYREIKILQTKSLGSHMLLWGESIAETPINPPSGHLYLVHFLHRLKQKENGLSYPQA